MLNRTVRTIFYFTTFLYNRSGRFQSYENKKTANGQLAETQISVAQCTREPQIYLQTVPTSHNKMEDLRSNLKFSFSVTALLAEDIDSIWMC